LQHKAEIQYCADTQKMILNIEIYVFIKIPSIWNWTTNLI